jgi:hypothetical protein
MTLNREKLVIGDTAHSLVLAIYHPTSGPGSADKLALLASYSAAEPFPQS